MNLEIFRLINNLANRNIVLDKIMIFFSKYIPYIFIVILGLVFILGIVKKNKDASFPSDHAIGTISIALGLEKYNKLLSIVLTILSMIVGFSRVYVGHHYPMDVIGAYIIAFMTSYDYNHKVKNKIENLYEIVEKKLVITLGFERLYNEV